MTCVIDEGRLPCDSISEKPGMVAFAQVAMDRDRRLQSLGIANCRSVRGGLTPSKHGNAEAWDPAGDTAAVQRLVDASLAAHEALHVQRAIWQRRIWDCRRGWHPYSGEDPHTGHAHIELDRWGAEHLTLNAIVQAFGLARHRRPPDVPKLTDIVNQVRLPARDGTGTVRVQLEYQGGVLMPDGPPVGGFKGSFFNLPQRFRDGSTGRFFSIEAHPSGRGSYEITDTGGHSYAFTPAFKRDHGIK